MRHRRSLLYWTILLAALASPFVSLQANTPTDAVAGFYEDALVRFRDNDLSGALIQLKNAIQEDPGFLPAHLLLADVYLRQNNGAAAEDEVRIADRLGADEAVTVVLLADAFLQQFKYLDVIDQIRAEGFETEVQAEILVRRGRAYIELRDLDQAEQEFNRAGQLAPDSAKPLVGNTTVMMYRGALDEAEQLARMATARAPKDPEAWNIRASVEHLRGQRDQAIASYGKVVELAPNHIDARIARIGVLMDLGRNDEAVADVEYLRLEFPLEPRGAYLYGLLLARDGDAEGAREASMEAVRIIQDMKPEILDNRPQFLLLAGLANHSLREFEQARAFLERYLEHEPHQTGARKLLSSIMLSAGDYIGATRVLDRALERNPNDPRVLSLLATAYMRQGRHELATPLLERASQLKASAPEIRTQLGLSRLSGGDRSQGVTDLTAVFHEEPGQTPAGIALVVVHLTAGRFEEAQQVAEILVEREPENLTAVNLLGSAQLSAGDRVQARETFQKAVAMNQAFLPARINLGKLDLIEGKREEARQRFLSILDEYPENVRTMMELARIAEQEGDPDEAIRWLEKARSIDARALSAVLYLVEVYLRTGNPQTALAVAKEAETWAPENLEVLNALARCQLAVGKRGIAQVIYRRMAELVEFKTEQLYRIAGYQLAADFGSDAIWTLQKAVQGNPDYLPAEAALTNALLRYGNMEKALEHANELRAKYPDRAIGHTLIGDVLMRLERYDEAFASFQAALAREPTSGLAVRLYQAQSQGGDLEKAIGFLEQWVAEHPRERVPTQALAEAYLQRQELDAARAQYETLLENWPNSPGILNNLALIYFRMGIEGALAHARRAHDLAPSDPAIADTLGWLLVQDGQASQGLKYLREAHSRSSADPEIRYHIAVALARLDRREEARMELELALNGDQDFDSADEARALLKTLGN